MKTCINLPFLAVMLSAALITGLYGNSASARDEVCVYEKKNYEGDEFCTAHSISNLAEADWNDDISSVELRGDIEVILYNNADYNGKSTRLSGDTSHLRNGMDNKASSLKIVSADDGENEGNAGNALSNKYPAGQGWRLQQYCNCNSGKRCYVRNQEVGECVFECPSGCKN